VAFLVLTFVPTYSNQSCRVGTDGAQECSSDSSTLVEENWEGVLLFLTVPFLMAAFGLATTLMHVPKAAGWTNAVLFLALCILTGFSIGLLHIPAGLLLLMSMILGEGDKVGGGPAATVDGRRV
jgi:hypothetical protein